MKLTGLIGHPVAHSLSPLIHHHAFESLDLDGLYLKMDILPNRIVEAIDQLEALGFTGLNVTIPFKQTVLPLTDVLSDTAKRTGAVNTILFRDGKRHGFNTDHGGFTAPLLPYSNEIKNEQVLVFGAGGAARAVVYALLHDFEPEKIVVANRTEQKAGELVRSFKSDRVEMTAYPVRDPGDYRLIVNATSVGRSSDTDYALVGSQKLLKPTQIVYDLVYTPAHTHLLTLARTAGCHTIGGIPMLVHQALKSIEIWTGQRTAETEADRLIRLVQQMGL